MLTLEHALSSNANRIVQQRAIMIISNRVRKLGHTASGYMRIAVKKHESKTSPGGRTERRSYATVGQSIESNVPDIDEIPAPQYVARLFGDPAIGTARLLWFRILQPA